MEVIVGRYMFRLIFINILKIISNHVVFFNNNTLEAYCIVIKTLLYRLHHVFIYPVL